MPQLHSQRVVKTRVRFFSFLWLILAGFWTQFAIANNNLLASMSLISNDAPCDAILLSVGNTCNPVVSTTENSTDSGVGDPECDEYGKQDVWFKAVIPLSGSMVIETITETDLGSVFQPDRWLNSLGLAVYNGSCYSLASMACTANNNGKNPHDAMAYLFDENPGDTIYIRVFDTKEGKFNRFSICAYDPGNGFFENFPKNICSSEGPIDLNSKIQESKHGNADLVISSNKASTPNKILGVPDGEYAGLYHYGEMLTVDLTDTIPKGEIIELYFTTSYATVGYSSISLATSLDNETYTALSYKPASLTNAIKPVYIVAENDTRYVKLINENNFAGFIVDAIQYHYGRSKAGVWSGPGVLDHVFYPEKQSGQIPITYSVGTISEKVDSTIYINVLNSNGGKLSRDTTVCYGSAEFYLKLSDYSGEIIQWQSSQDDFLSYSDHRVTSDRFLIEKPTRATSYRVIVQDGTCLQDTSNVVAVKVHQPVRALLSGGTTLCEGEEAQLQLELTGEAPWKVVYAQNSEMISLDDIMNSPATIQVTPLTTTTYQLVSVENVITSYSIHYTKLYDK